MTVDRSKTNDKYNKFSHLRNDPDFKSFLDELIDDRMGSKKRAKTDDHDHDNRGQDGHKQNRKGISSGENCVELRDSTPNHQRTFKSPSDTTIYSPGLRKANNDKIALIEKISNFVENICLDGSRSRSNRQSSPAAATGSGDTRRVEQADRHRNVVTPTAAGSTGSPLKNKSGGHFSSPLGDRDDCHPDAVTDQLLVQAEKFKAQVEAPKGRNNLSNFPNYNNYTEMLMPYDYEKLRTKFVRPEGLAPIDSEILFLRNFDQDDEFFHVTSQIEPALRSKIEQGEYIDLERLLPKDRNSGAKGATEDLNRQLYQLITQGTNTFVDPPVQRSGKITNIRKWDQAFRVFAAIYTNANPERASEIWQYIYVIHTAASANPWDNVYFYDINFCELMATKPWRSWGKTYTQGWNMAFNNSQLGSHQNGGVSYNSRGGGAEASTSRDWKQDCCWRFNKKKCKRSGSDCNYDHRCTYCAGWNHGFHNCRKRRSKFRKSSSPPRRSSSPKHDKGDKK